MEIGAPEPFVVEPPRKGARWLFLPTLLLGLLAAAGGGYALLTSALGQGAGLPWFAALLIFAFGAFMAVVGAFALTIRSRVTIDGAGGSVRVERRSVVWSRDARHALSLFDRVELREVRRSGNADQGDPVGAYTMIWLAGPAQKVHVASDRASKAVELAERISVAARLPVIRQT